LQPVAPGEAGELHIGGPGVTRGYLNLPEKTSKAFVESPFYPGERLYKTGDLVKMDESGLIYFVGRVDFQVKIRGFRIELGEIESCLDQYPQIQHRIVIAREDTPGDKRLVAYVTTHDGQALDRTALKAFLSEQLPAFMIPSAIVALPELPKNANGKIDRKALPLPAQADTERTLIPARTPLEEKLVSLWESVLGVFPVGIADDFFELGGHSLLVMRLFSELEALFDRRLPLIEIFAAPTIEKMAERLEEITAAASTTATDNTYDNLFPLRLGRVQPPLFLVHDVDGDTGLYIHLARRMKGDRAIYAIQPQGTEDVPLAQSRISEMAHYCIEQMRQVQPAGPYLIGGLCAGGVIAFEAALQLEQAGEKVALTLLDSPEPTLENREGSLKDERKSRLGEVLASKDVPSIIRQVWKKGTNVIRYEVTSRLEATAACARGHAFRWWQDQQWPLPKPLQGIPIRETITFAFDTYRPAHQLASQMLLIRASEGDGTKADLPYVELCGDPLLGWASRVQQEIRVCDVPGGHSTMLSDTNVQALADALNTFVQDSTADPSS
ncbi:MAG: thioesterase domain-containing protein, partial [Pseudomonadota bacterium]